MTIVEYLTYDKKGNILYEGGDSRRAEDTAIAVTEGIAHFVSYHTLNDKVCINDITFRDGIEIGHDLVYILNEDVKISNEEVKIMTKLLKTDKK